MTGLGGMLLLVRRSLRLHAFSSTITAASLALAGGLVMSVFAIEAQTRVAFTGGDLGYDAVLGGRGSPLQLVLNSVFHLDTSPGNIPWAAYDAIAKRPDVAIAVPIAVGDNYHGFRIVGTTLDMFEKLEFQHGRRLTIAPGGRLFDPALREAVVGRIAAEQTGLRVGDTIHPYHGIDFDEQQRHDDEYLIVGILEQTNTPNDRVIFIPIEGVYHMSGHELRGPDASRAARPGEPIPSEYKEVSAVLLKLRGPQAGQMLHYEINKQGRVATFAWPIGAVMGDLFDKLGWASRVLRLVAYLVVAVAAGAVLASIYNSMNERRRDFAILRALGARRATVFVSIVLEATGIATFGALASFIVYGAILSGAAYVVHQQTGVIIDRAALHPALYLAPLAMILLGALTGLLPAYKAYATDVASNLAPTN